MMRTVIYHHARLPRAATTTRALSRHLSHPPSCAFSSPLLRITQTTSLQLTQHQHCPLSTSPNLRNTQPPSRPPKIISLLSTERRRTFFLLFLPTALLAIYLTLTDENTQPGGKPLNPATFSRFTILDREQVSPTAFILTVAPARDQHVAATETEVKRAWAHGLWSVEVKQPQLQVARDYTPLPMVVAEGGEGEGEGKGGREGRGGKMRFYIRKMDRGEVSGYLAGLRVGDVVELRGPRLGFDVRERVGAAATERDGEGKKVVFFAGGTGIAPALQAARALLFDRRSEGVEMEVVWANRRREDCDKDGAVVAMLEDLRKMSGGRFSYSCTVDEEGSFVDAAAITRATGVSRTASGGGLWSFRVASQEDTAPSTTISNACHYHSAQKLAGSNDSDPHADDEGQHCQCRDESSNAVAGGKNLLMFSGPEGFITYYTGAKLWWGGKELQGQVTGVVGELKRRYPSLGNDWLVLKM